MSAASAKGLLAIICCQASRERTVGRERFDAWLKGWFSRHKFAPVTTSIFLADLREHLIKGDSKLETALQLDRWVSQPGVPDNVFKADPQAKIWGKPAEALGGKLLVSGFWGIGRKLNYTGELCMYYAWTLPTGFRSVIPYLLPLWLTLFFPHRAWRDEQRCQAKYGDLWLTYKRRAKFRMIPFIF